MGQSLNAFEGRNLEVELSCLLSETEGEALPALNGTPRVTLPHNRNRMGRTAAGNPDRSAPRCANKHCVPCWNRSSTVISIAVRAMATARAAAPIRRSAKRNCSFALPAVHWVVDMDCPTCFDTLDHGPDPAQVSGVRVNRWQRVGLLEQFL